MSTKTRELLVKAHPGGVGAPVDEPFYDGWGVPDENETGGIDTEV